MGLTTGASEWQGRIGHGHLRVQQTVERSLPAATKGTTNLCVGEVPLQMQSSAPRAASQTRLQRSEWRLGGGGGGVRV